MTIKQKGDDDQTKGGQRSNNFKDDDDQTKGGQQSNKRGTTIKQKGDKIKQKGDDDQTKG